MRIGALLPRLIRHPLHLIARVLLMLLALAASGARGLAVAVEDYAVRMVGTVSISPPRITISWSVDPDATAYNVFRRTQPTIAEGWGAAVNAAPLPGNAASYIDSTVVARTLYEYRVVKDANDGAAYQGHGFLSSGIELPVLDSRGTVILVVDATHAADLASELKRLISDLVGDGWKVVRHDVARTETVVNVKALIKAEYDADPAGMKSVFLFGHVPVPYSGNIAPDGHVPDHFGAWPADLFYGDMDGVYTDGSVNNTGAGRSQNRNIPGDGKYDQSTVPLAAGGARVELQVGRVDLADMPAFAKSERELLRQYLAKDHAFRHKQLTAPVRGLIDDSFGTFNGEAFAVNGWRNFRPLMGSGSTFALDWVTTLRTESYLWAYGCGGGSYTSAGGVAATADFATNDLRAIFTMIFGSYHGDWDVQNNLLRAPLAGATHGLSCAWAGRPHWYFHAMGMGETLGCAAQQTQSNGGNTYPTGLSGRGTHVALMGDPTLRMFAMSPPSNVVGTANASGGIDLTWVASPDAASGYHVYMASAPGGPFARLSATPVSATVFNHPGDPTNKTYMVRAVRLETTPSGSFFNQSQGVFDTFGELTAAITSPVTGSSIPLGAFTIDAVAADEDSTIAKVEFFNGATLLGEDTTAPYSHLFSNPPAGRQVLTVRATNLLGETVDSLPVTVLVGAYTPPAVLNFNTVFITPDLGQDGTASTSLAQILDGGATLRLNGNCAKRVTLSAPYVVSPTTLVQFDFQSSAQGEYHGISLDEDDDSRNSTRLFQLYGTQTSGLQTYRDYTGGSGWKTYTLPVAQHYTGAMNFLVFTLDHDAAVNTAASNGSFRNVRIFEGSIVSITASDPAAAELGLQNGAFTVTRAGPLDAELTVQLTSSGSATSGSDFTATPVTITFAIGADSVLIPISPLADSLAEGSEAIIRTIAPAPGYGVALAGTATITLADLPFDAWRFANFTPAERGNTAISGPLADPDRDGIANLLESLLATPPKVPSTAGLPVVTRDPAAPDRLQISYRRVRPPRELTDVVEVTSDVGAPAWNSGPAFTDAISVTDLGDGTEQVVVRDKTSLSAVPGRFIRLRVSR